jgi:hypothetical protein
MVPSTQVPVSYTRTKKLNGTGTKYGCKPESHNFGIEREPQQDDAAPASTAQTPNLMYNIYR